MRPVHRTRLAILGCPLDADADRADTTGCGEEPRQTRLPDAWVNN